MFEFGASHVSRGHGGVRGADHNGRSLGYARGLLAAAVIAGLTVAAWVPAATAAGGWHPPVTLSAAGDNVLGPPRVAMDRAGNATAVWTAYGRGSDDVFAQAATRPAGGGFSRPVKLSTTDADYAYVATSPTGETVAVWSGFFALQAAIRPAGGSFSTPARLSAIGDENVGVALAIDQVADAIVVLDGEFTDHGVQAVLRPAGGSFSRPINLSRRNALSPQVAIDQAGDAIVVWTRMTGRRSVAQAVVRRAGGSFSKPMNLSARRQSADDAQVAIDQAGDAIVVWTHDTGKRSVVQAVVRPAGGSFSKPMNLSAKRQSAYGARVAIDQGGNAIVVWARSKDERGIVQAVVRPAGGSFSTAVNLSLASKKKGVLALPLPEVAINPSGDAIVGWVRHVTRSGLRRVQAAMRPAGGDFSKPANLSPAFQEADAFTRSPDVAISPSGSATAVWDRDIGKRTIAQAATYDATAGGRPITGR